MNNVQELIDENKDQMPMALAKKLVDACKAEADAKPKLYHVKITRVNSVVYDQYDGDDETHACVKLQDQTHTLIAEPIDTDTFRAMNICTPHLLTKGMILDHWVNMVMPIIFNQQTKLVIVH